MAIDVVYPAEGGRIAARDSNFIFGSVGDGQARLRINGRGVPVEPNGAFLAWLPVPLVTDSTASYELVAWVDDDTVHARHHVTVTRSSPPSSAALAIDTASLSPTGVWWVRPGERVTFDARATPGSDLRLVLPDGSSLQLRETLNRDGAGQGRWVFGRIPDVSARAIPRGWYRGTLTARVPLGGGARSGHPPLTRPEPAFQRASCGQPWAETPSDGGLAPDTTPSPCAYLEATRATDTVRAALPLELWIYEEPGVPVELRESPSALGSDGWVIGRAMPDATSTWFWDDGVRARVIGRRNDSVRLRLDRRTSAWVGLDEVIWPVGPVDLAPRSRVGTVRLSGARDHLRVRISVDPPAPYDVVLDGDRASITIYGAYSATNWLRYGAHDPFLEGARWEQLTDDRYVLHLHLAQPAWGYRARWESDRLAVDIRKPPTIDRENPLAGRTVIIDPGHPPGGATGPTRLYEGDANLAIAHRVRRYLQDAGARVFLTRTERGSVRLYDRTARAEQLDAEILVSIHNNALPDGVNPFGNHGTSVYYFHPPSLDLARSIQQALLESMGLADLGIGRASLALIRPSWMPAVLTEGAFMMIPRQEAGLRQPEFQDAYARGVVEGLRRFLRGRAR